MKVLITGGAGYLGSVMAPALIARGFHVTVIDNLMYSQTTLTDLCHHDHFQFIAGDVRDPQLLKKHVPGADYIIPLACLTGAPLCDRDPWAARAVIIDAVRELLDLRRPEQRILYPNTNSGYGIGDQGSFCTEDSPLRPISLYGRLKVEAENMILAAGNAVTFRLATVFGASPRMRLDLLVNDFVYRAVHDGCVVLYQANAKRNYIHVRDVTNAFIHAIDNWATMQGSVYNLGLSDANLSKRELCEHIQEHLPKFYFTEAAIGEDPDKRDYIVSNARIEATGFKPEFSLDKGIRELIKLYRIIKPVRHDFTNYP